MKEFRNLRIGARSLLFQIFEMPINLKLQQKIQEIESHTNEDKKCTAR